MKEESKHHLPPITPYKAKISPLKSKYQSVGEYSNLASKDTSLEHSFHHEYEWNRKPKKGIKKAKAMAERRKEYWKSNVKGRFSNLKGKLRNYKNL